ncbi:unnamed protein product, partial [Discosporangium mesarthrocarpum]
VSYAIVEERPVTSYSPFNYFVMEVRLDGVWHEATNQGIKRWEGRKRFQGIGKSTREGRNKAAERALAGMAHMMPGIKLAQGVIPGDWARQARPQELTHRGFHSLESCKGWLKENNKRGVGLHRLLSQLRSKGFSPAKNSEMMQWALATSSLDRLMEDAPPEAEPTANNGQALGPPWRAWADHCLSIGVDGSVLLEALQARGVDTGRLGLLTQRLRRSEGGTGADPVYPSLLDFWQCCDSGLLFEVELYLSAGQSPDEAIVHLPRGAVCTPLALAASKGHCRVMDALISRGANVDTEDRMGRTALHHAAKAGELEACRYNKPDCCELLAFHGEETTRHVLSDRIPVADRPMTQIMTEVFHHMLSLKLASNETHRFRKEWILEAVMWCHEQMNIDKRRLLQVPSADLVRYVVGRFDPDPDAGFWHKFKGNLPEFVPSIASPEHLSEIMRHVYRLAVCDSRDNRQGYLALHQACFENRIDSHEEVIRILAVYHHLNLYQVDNNGKLAVELLYEKRARPGTPTGSSLRESLIMERRRDVLREAREAHDKRDREEIKEERSTVLQALRHKAVDMDPSMWKVTQEASLHLRTLGGWMEYVDPDTSNRFFYRNELVLRVVSKSDSAEEKRKEDNVEHFQWDKPVEFARDEAERLGWANIFGRSDFLRSHAARRYNAVRDRMTGVVFYIDTSTEKCLTRPPLEASWQEIFKRSEGTGRWERPFDAVMPVDLTAGDYPACTMETITGRNDEMFRVCVACARNCHKVRLGHRTRFCKVANTRCMCCERGNGSCLYFMRKICRRKPGIPKIGGWVTLQDPEPPLCIEVGTRVMPKSFAAAKTPEPLEWQFLKSDILPESTLTFLYHEER